MSILRIPALLLFPALLHAQDKPADDDRTKTEAFVQQLRTGKLECRLDALVDIPTAWSLTPDKLDAAFTVPKEVGLKKNPYFQWMTTDRTRAVFMKHAYNDLRTELSLFGGTLPVEEAVVDFIDGKLNTITFSLCNTGDTGNIPKDEFEKRFKLCGEKVGAALGVRPNLRKADISTGILSEGWIWLSAKGMAALESNPEAHKGEVAFLRLRIAPREAKGAAAAAFGSRSSTAKLSDLPRNLTKQPDGDVLIKGIPMVDQGPKGYCVVSSVQRLFEYYGISTDQHQLAQIAGTDARAGTNIMIMSEVLGKIDYRFKTRFKILCLATTEGLSEVNERKKTIGKPFTKEKFIKEIHTQVNAGVPLLWGLMLGMYPEQPAIAQQTGGGHMRMIIGYNDKNGQLLFTDSWGAGHELKRMSIDDAYKASLGLFTMLPTVQ